MGPDPRAVGDARPPRRARYGPAAGHARVAGDPPSCGGPRQAGGHAGRDLRRAGVLRGRCGLVRAGAPGVRRAVPAGPWNGSTRWPGRSRRCARSGRRARKRMRVNGFRSRDHLYPRPVGSSPISSAAPAPGRCGSQVPSVTPATSRRTRRCSRADRRGAPSRGAGGAGPRRVAMTVLDVAVVGDARRHGPPRGAAARANTGRDVRGSSPRRGTGRPRRALRAAARDGGQRDVPGPPGPHERPTISTGARP